MVIEDGLFDREGESFVVSVEYTVEPNELQLVLDNSGGGGSFIRLLATDCTELDRVALTDDLHTRIVVDEQVHVIHEPVADPDQFGSARHSTTCLETT